jgi:hypothetical protein
MSQLLRARSLILSYREKQKEWIGPRMLHCSNYRLSATTLFGSRRMPRSRVPQPEAPEGIQFTRHGRACPGHPRLALRESKTWMPGSSSAKTRFALLPGHDGESYSAALLAALANFFSTRSRFSFDR